MNCKHCNSENCVIKKGKTITGKQRYFCKQCEKTFVLKVLIQILESIFHVYKENPNVFQDL